MHQRAPARGQQDFDHRTDLRGGRGRPRGGQQPAGVGQQYRVGGDRRQVQVAGRRTRPVNGWSNRSPGPNTCRKNPRSAGAGVGEDHRQRLPVGPHQGAHAPTRFAVVRSRSAGHGYGRPEIQRHPAPWPARPPREPQVEDTAVRLFVADQQVQCAAEIGLLPQHHAQRTECRQPPAGRQPDGEVLDTGLGRRALQQAGDRHCGNPLVLLGQVADVEPLVGQEPRRIQAEGAGQLRVARQRCVADEAAHVRSFRSPPVARMRKKTDHIREAEPSCRLPSVAAPVPAPPVPSVAGMPQRIRRTGPEATGPGTTGGNGAPPDRPPG